MDKKILSFLCCLLFFSILFWSCKKSSSPATEVETVRYTVPIQSSAQSSHAMISGTASVPSIQAGLEAMREGGSAIDAVLTSALAQIATHAGSTISYAGILCIVYYDAETRRVYSLDATYKIPQEENDPLSIPTPGSPDGRTALVSGFMAGVQAAHDRFGRLPFQRIFQPAIDMGENGFIMPNWLAGDIERNWNVLSRLPETRRVFTKENGERYRANDRFFQPELAQTLRRVASEGAAYMYTGEWAQNFVNIVRREGGNVTLADMQSYRVDWHEPSHTTYNGYDIYSLEPLSLGGVATIEAFNLLEYSNLGNTAHYSTSAELLYQFIMIERVRFFLTYMPHAPDILESIIPGSDFSPRSRLRKETSRHIWNTIHSGEWHQIERMVAIPPLSQEAPAHTATVVAVDENGNAAALLHTINTYSWGTTGIFIDGVSIPDSAAIRQRRMERVGAGNYLPDNENPCLVTQNGYPILVSSSTGGGQHSETIQNIYNILAFGFDPRTSLETAKFLTPNQTDIFSHDVLRNTFSESTLDGVRSLGQPLVTVNSPNQLWTGIRIDPETGMLYGVTSGVYDCLTEGY